MRKLFALLMVCATLLSLTACSGSTENWKIKNIEAPKVTLTRQPVDFTSEDGVQDSVIVSPFTSDMKHAEAAEAISKLKCMSGATVTKEYTEDAVPFITETAQYMSYLASHIYTIEQTNGHKVVVQYVEFPDDVLGFSTIMVEIFEGEKKLKQSEIYEILLLVYGEEYASYLCYGKMTSEVNYEYHDIIQDDMAFSFERVIKPEMGAAFVVGVYNANENTVYGYSGDFAPRAQGFSTIADFLRWDVNTMPNDVNNIGKAFFEKYYGEDVYCVPVSFAINDSAYAYEYKESQDSWSTKMRYALHFDDEEAYPLTVQLATAKTNDAETAAYIFSVKALQNATGDECAEVKQYALSMVQEIMGDIDVSNAFADNQVYEITMNGKPAVVQFKFSFVSDGNGYQVATITIQTSTDMNAFDA